MAESDPVFEAMIARARAEGLWFWAGSLDYWLTPDQFIAAFPGGVDLPSSWGMTPPDQVIAILRGRVDQIRTKLQHAEAELARAIRAARSPDA